MAFMTAQEFDSQFGKCIRDVFDNNSKLYEEGKSYFPKIAKVEDTKEWTSSFTSFVDNGYANTVGELGLIPLVWAEKGHKATLEVYDIKDSVIVSMEELEKRKDQTEMLKFVTERTTIAIKAVYHKLEQDVQSLFNNATTTAIWPDGQPLISNSHTFRAGGSTWSNLLTGTAINESLLNEIDKFGQQFKDDLGRPNPFRMKIFHVRAGSDAAHELKKMLKINTAGGYQYLAPQTFNDVNIYVGNGYEIHENPYLLDDKKVFVTCDFDNLMMKNPLYVGMYKRPTSMETVYNPRNASFETNVISLQQIGLRNVPVGIAMAQLV